MKCIKKEFSNLDVPMELMSSVWELSYNEIWRLFFNRKIIVYSFKDLVHPVSIELKENNNG